MDFSDNTKITLGTLAACITLVGFLPYFYNIYRSKTKPHAFSWLIWAILTGIGYAGQLSEDAGPGAWTTASTALLCFLVFVLALFKGEKNIKKSDWVCLIIALAAIPLWLVTSTPLWSVILVTLIDILAFWPTLRKSYLKPFEETAFTFFAGALSFMLGIIVLNKITIITALYPCAIAFLNALCVSVLLIRRDRARH
jgi:hypothetical protein